MELDYIIVQAGGKGTRMQGLTRNKPKALVPINNLPMIFHLFKKYPKQKYIIIGDYKYDVLEKYLQAFSEVEYQLVCGTGHTGTCAGLAEALTHIPAGKRFLLIWCDLVLPMEYEVLDSESNIIGISKDFPCRWKYENGEFSEESSKEHGVAGHFIFTDKSFLKGIPEDGEFVRWLKEKKIHFEEQALYRTHEYGLYSEWNKLSKMRCRPFNRVVIHGDKVYKTAISEQGQRLAEREVAWYKKLEGIRFKNIPEIYEYEPLCMEYIAGKNIYEYAEIPIHEKRKILEQLIGSLRKIHIMETVSADMESYLEAYVEKTFQRLGKVKKLMPFAEDEKVIINGVECRNVLFCKELLVKEIIQYFPDEFCLIHGDCTFSNIILRNDGIPFLIDPRGYFGNTEFFGDAAYDWAKLYYSLVSNYDQFNLKHFALEIGKDGVKLDIASNNWEMLEDDFYTLLHGEVTKKQMKLLLAVIWLSLTTYAWEDYDSICGAFYNGLLYWEKALVE